MQGSTMPLVRHLHWPEVEKGQLGSQDQAFGFLGVAFVERKIFDTLHPGKISTCRDCLMDYSV